MKTLPELHRYGYTSSDELHVGDIVVAVDTGIATGGRVRVCEVTDKSRSCFGMTFHSGTVGTYKTGSFRKGARPYGLGRRWCECPALTLYRLHGDVVEWASSQSKSVEVALRVAVAQRAGDKYGQAVQ